MSLAQRARLRGAVVAGNPHQIRRDLGEKAARLPLAGVSERHAPPARGEVEGEACPGHGDVEQAALLLLFLGRSRQARRGRLASGKDALLQPGHDHLVEFQALGVVRGDQRHRRACTGCLLLLLVRFFPDPGQAGGFQELGQAGGAAAVVGAGADQLVQVQGAPGALRLVLRHHAFVQAGALQHRPHQVGHGAGLLHLAQIGQQPGEPGQRHARRSAPRGGQRGGGGNQIAARGARLLCHAGRGLGPDAAPRLSRSAPEGDLVAWIVQQCQVGQGVLDLLALVETHRTHHAVRDAQCLEQRLERA